MKYELRPEEGTDLFRLVPTAKFSTATGYEHGGLVSGPHNLSQEGRCWVFPHARITGDALVTDDADVGGEATVSGHARVCGNATVGGRARVTGRAVIKDFACVNDKAMIFDSVVVQDNAGVTGRAMVMGNAVIDQRAQIFESGLVRDTAKISGHTIVGGSSNVGSGLWVLDGVVPYVCNSAGYFGNVEGPGRLRIGCQSLSIADCLDVELMRTVMARQNVPDSYQHGLRAMVMFLVQEENRLRWANQLS